ncbi:unannotated protein [freshwater metagenome]|uniref:Unannotated protein n=1 Tax=freshwater metagenome TaxID=449393 RepID=A0A6J7EUI4_9ZZZZ|nr:pilus assembly protein TadE [Actinomycetota bacterium]
MMFSQQRTVGRQRGNASRRDRGEATTQLVILTPLLVILVFLGVQSALYFHAANVAAAAASQGAAAASPSSTGATSALAAAQRTITELGAHSARAPVVALDGSYVVVTVEIAVPLIVPFFPHSVTRRALEPRERFVPESNR